MSADAYRAVRQTATAGEAPILEGCCMPFSVFTEIRSSVEGHFLERFSPGSLAKTIRERKGRIRALFEHGMDLVLGRMVVADVEGIWEEPDGAYYRAALLPGVPDLLVEGLRRGVYGSSIRFGAVKVDRNRAPRRSEYNPEGIEERTVREARLLEFSVVTFPAYAKATAHVRSLTDEVQVRKLVARLALDEGVVAELAADPERMQALIGAGTRALPPPRSRQPTRDTLSALVR